jgi:hypothetical protein
MGKKNHPNIMILTDQSGDVFMAMTQQDENGDTVQVEGTMSYTLPTDWAVAFQMHRVMNPEPTQVH